ncbi:hypothetical protein [Paenibacillus humicola]|uniref:hypothetical protein n=1 Tax=Paenibacillus humicola TaxID=3110540 RepID=UPI00237AC032|nr:hypothetical protein [Paenibacillus humicola]
MTADSSEAYASGRAASAGLSSGKLTVSLPRSSGQLPVYYNAMRGPSVNRKEIETIW